MATTLDTPQSIRPTGNETTGQRNRETTGDTVGRWLAFGALVLFALIWLAPIVWAVLTSLKPEADTTVVPIRILPETWTVDAYTSVLSAGNLMRWFANSFIVAAGVTLLCVLITSLAAFGISRIDFKGRYVIFGVILAGIVVPGQILIVPLFVQVQSLGLIDTYWGIILPQIAAPVAVFIFKQFFDGIPREMEDAARTDGATSLRIYWEIWMPLARSAIAAVAIFTFVGAWNNFLLPFILTTDPNQMTLPVGLAVVQSEYGIRYAQIMASALLAGLPLVVVFLFFQRQIVQGIAGAGLKG